MVTAMIRRSMAVMKGIEFQIMIYPWRTPALGLPYDAFPKGARQIDGRVARGITPPRLPRIFMLPNHDSGKIRGARDLGVVPSLPGPLESWFNGGTVTLHTGGRNKRPELPPREYYRGLVNAG
jgi:hypothetical protein